MADDPKATEPFTLGRWSRRKHEAARASPSTPVVPPPAQTIAPTVPEASAPEPLPPVESLSIDSDFSAFMKPKVDDDVKRAALKKLFSDARFNVMDGLDVYIDDYTKPDPMPEGMLGKLAKVYDALKSDAERDAREGAAALSQAAEAPAIAAPEPAVPLDAKPLARSDPMPAQDPQKQ
jgi:hypothetical protein